ncbi:Jitterbug, partial [Operophtera brumata]
MGEQRVHLPVDIREDGSTHRVRLRPTVPAHYRIYVTYGEDKDGTIDWGLLECRVVAGAPREWLCAYIPLNVGLYEVIDTSSIMPVGGWGADNSGRVRAPSKLVLDTSNAGPGTLECLLAGRHQRVETVSGRAVVTLAAAEGVSGEQELELTYNGALVSGAPRKALVASGNTADRVRVYGPGLEPGVLATFQSRFLCDTRGAGAGQLTVRVRGPKGAFRVEMQRESQKDRTILCK